VLTHGGAVIHPNFTKLSSTAAGGASKETDKAAPKKTPAKKTPDKKAAAVKTPKAKAAPKKESAAKITKKKV